MEASQRIRDAVARVSDLRQLVSQSSSLSGALSDIKAMQARRFEATYKDLLESPVYAGCTNFFLVELYSERDYSHRDAQFAKVAKAIELTFPAHVASIAVTLAELHQTTEELDLEMAKSWESQREVSASERYLASWREVGQRAKREWQLDTVLTIGEALSELTQKRGLRLLLKMMRKPAEMTGLGDLQVFLETGFDQFRSLARNTEAVSEFLRIIHERESRWISHLFDTAKIPHNAKNAQSFDWAFRALGA